MDAHPSNLAPSPRRPRRGSPRWLAVLAALAVTVAGVLVAVAPGPAGAGPPTGGQATALTLTAGEDGTLTVAGGAGEPAGLALAVASEADVGWDLTGLDRGRYRSDLVRIELDGVEGPGRFTATAASPFGGAEVLVDRDAGVDGFVLQVGHQGTMRWSFDQPGAHRLRLRATIPEVGGTVATATATYDLVVAEDQEPVAAPPADPGPGEPRPLAATAEPPTATTEPPTVTDEVAGARPAAAAAVAQAAPAGTRVVIDEGHVDMGPRFVDGAWRVQLRDDSTSPVVWRDLADVVLHARESSRIEVPPGDAYAFLGAPGASVHVLPLVQQAGLVWPGWNTQDPSLVGVVPGSVTWRLHGVEGPGRFLLYLTGTFGQTDILFDTAGGLPQDVVIAPNTHAHGNWAFTQAGTYRLRVEMLATTAEGTPVSDTRILTIAVGDAVDPGTAFTPDPNPGPSGPGSSGSGSTAPDPDPSSADLAITASLGDDAAGGGAGGGGGSLVQTGIDDLGTTIAVALALIAAGAVLAVVRRRATE